MSIDTYEGFDLEEAGKERLWRYIDLTAFAALVYSRRLYFPMLSALEDPWEGSPGMEDLIAHASASGSDGDQRLEAVVQLQRKYQRQRSSIVASCWYCANQESAAMWELYAGRGRGIAVQTTVERLCTAIEGDRPLTIGRVQYVDHLSSRLGDSKLRCAFSKNEAYSHEREVRIITQLDDEEVQLFARGKRLNGPSWSLIEEEAEPHPQTPKFAQIRMRNLRDNPPDGVYVPVSIDRLIERVVMSPRTLNWEEAAVEAIAKGLGLNVKLLEPSSLSSRPLHDTLLGRMVFGADVD